MLITSNNLQKCNLTYNTRTSGELTEIEKNNSTRNNNRNNLQKCNLTYNTSETRFFGELTKMKEKEK